jgi:hypothetical protein
MRILKDVTEGIEPFQQVLWDKINQGGFKHGEMMVISAGRQTGKSTLNQYMQAMQERIPYKELASAMVDDAKWFTVQCNKEVAAWLRTHPEKMCYEHIDQNWMIHKNIFDIHEKIYTMLQLKYGHDRI